MKVRPKFYWLFFEEFIQFGSLLQWGLFESMLKVLLKKKLQHVGVYPEQVQGSLELLSRSLIDFLAHYLCMRKERFGMVDLLAKHELSSQVMSIATW
ncbi:hypothetical protein GQ457_05G007560 [Hibiscus cannabinus]